MKTDRFLMVFAAMLAASLAWSVHAAETATVKRGKINVRGQASLKGETITQLSQGESVSILEEIKVASPKKGEPAVWAKIQLPSNTPVWVFAPYIDANKAVNINRLNVRGGPGENFSVLSRLERGAVVKEIRTVDKWMEIEPPADCVAYVALDLLEKATAVAVVPQPAPAATEPKPAPAPTTVETVQAEPPVAAANDKPVVEPKPEPVVETPAAAVPAATPAESAASTVPVVEPAPEPEPAPKRVVIREGRVVYSRSIQAPTTYALESLETRRIINYLHTEQTGLKLKSFAGRKVMVTGEELLDARWAYTPILEVEDISIAK